MGITKQIFTRRNNRNPVEFVLAVWIAGIGKAEICMPLIRTLVAGIARREEQIPKPIKWVIGKVSCDFLSHKDGEQKPHLRRYCGRNQNILGKMWIREKRGRNARLLL